MEVFSKDDVIISVHPEPVRHGMTTGKIPNGIKILHKATGLVAVCDKYRHQHLNKKEALSELAKALNKLNKQ